MTYKFNYPDNLSPLLELQVKSIESAANKFILQKPKERRERLIQLFQKEIDTLIRKTKIGEQKKEENLRRIKKQRELKETLLKKDNLRKLEKSKEEKKIRDEKEREEARERVKEWDRNENLFIASFIISLILFMTLTAIAPAFLSFLFLVGVPFFTFCIDYSFFKRPRPNFSSSRSPTEIKVNIPSHQIEDAVQKAIVTSLYQGGHSYQTSDAISRGIQKALGEMKYK